MRAPTPHAPPTASAHPTPAAPTRPQGPRTVTLHPFDELVKLLQRTPGMRSIEREAAARQTETYGVLVKGVMDNSVENLTRCVEAVRIAEGRKPEEVQRAYAKQKDGAKHGRAWTGPDETDADGPGYYQGEVAVFFTAERCPTVPSGCTVHQRVNEMDVDTTAERARGEYNYIARDMCLQCGAHAAPGYAIPLERHAQGCPRRPLQAAAPPRPTREQLDDIVVQAKHAVLAARAAQPDRFAKTSLTACHAWQTKVRSGKISAAAIGRTTCGKSKCMFLPCAVMNVAAAGPSNAGA